MGMTARVLLVAAIAALTGCAYSGTAGDYSVGGTVSGLSTNSGVLLTDAAGAGVFVSSNGRFSIDNAFVDGAAYDVAAASDPGTPSIRCTVSNGRGVVAGSDVDNLAIECAPQAFDLGGTVTGVDAVGLILSSRGVEIAVHVEGALCVLVLRGDDRAVPRRRDLRDREQRRHRQRREHRRLSDVPPGERRGGRRAVRAVSHP